MKNIATSLILAVACASCGSQSATTPNSFVPAASQGPNSQGITAPPSSLDELNTFSDRAAPNSSMFPGFANGRAYAAFAFVEPNVVVSGPIAPAFLECNTGTNTNRNSVASLNVPPYFVSNGTASDIVQSTRNSSTATVSSTSTIEGVSALNGAIQATTVEAQANTSASSGGATSNETGSRFVDLTVLGNHISANVAPNTKITLSGIGYVILNEVEGPENGPNASSITVRMIHVVITTANSLKLKIGTNIIIGSAKSDYEPAAAPYMTGANAYSLFVHGYANNINLTSGPYAPATEDCMPGSQTDRIASASTPVGTLGAMVNKVTTTNTASASSADGNSSTAATDLLGGLITASSIVTNAEVDRSGSTFNRSASTKFVSLTIAGKSISASVAPNTKITLANLGYVILNDQTGSTGSTSATQEINGLLVVVTTANSYKLPVGAQIVVGHARARVAGY